MSAPQVSARVTLAAKQQRIVTIAFFVRSEPLAVELDIHLPDLRSDFRRVTVAPPANLAAGH